GAHDLAAEGLADALQAEAYAENRELTGHLAQERQRDTGLLWRAGAGRDDDRVGMKRADARDVDGVVAPDGQIGAEFAEILHEVVGEGVVVIDHEQTFLSA